MGALKFVRVNPSLFWLVVHITRTGKNGLGLKNGDAPFFTPQVCAERALAADPHHLPAVYVLASVLEADNRIDAAIELLRSHLNHQSTSQLHLMLADLLGKERLK